VAYAGSDEEYIVLANAGNENFDLAGYLLGDAERPGDGEGMYALPDVVLAPGTLFAVARQADAFYARFGRWPDASFEPRADLTSHPDAASPSSPADRPVPALVRRADLAHGKLALNDAGDEVLLLAPGLSIADAMAYGKADYAALRLTGELRAAHDFTLQRVPGAAYPSVADVRHRFLAAPPRPFEPRGLPLGGTPNTVGLDEGYTGVWGSLGAHSNFCRGFTAPPHYVLAAAAAAGLRFVAIADPGVVAPPVWNPPDFTWLPAWAWEGGAPASAAVNEAAVNEAAVNEAAVNDTAVIYDASPTAGLTSDGLRAYLASRGSPLQWQGKSSTGPAGVAGVVALAADDGRSEDIGWFFKRWALLRAPLLPAGNAEPDLPGAIAVAPHYTGLAVRSADTEGILAALRAGRGWLTTDSSTWLTLRVTAADGSSWWMGSTLSPAAALGAGTGAGGAVAVTLDITYGDLGGEPASLAVWEDGVRMEELLLTPADGRWRVAVAAAPGAMLAVVATQADGDFAVTAPVQMPPPAPDNGGAPTDGLPDNGNPGGVPRGSPPPVDSPQTRPPVAPPPAPALDPTYGQAGGPPGSVAQAKLAGLGADVEIQAVVTAPPGLFNDSMYVADVAPDGATAGIGANVYLRTGDFPPLVEGDFVGLRGRWSSYRGEMELVVGGPQDVWKLRSGPPLRPLAVWPHRVCESVEGRLVSFAGMIVGWQGDSLLLVDPAHPAATPLRVTVRSSLPWKRPYVYKGEIWQVTGVVSQFARSAPWNGGYRILPRYVEDLVRTAE
jgi:hypothetical protein